MGNKSKQEAQASEALQKLNQAVAEAEAEFDAKSKQDVVDIQDNTQKENLAKDSSSIQDSSNPKNTKKITDKPNKSASAKESSSAEPSSKKSTKTTKEAKTTKNPKETKEVKEVKEAKEAKNTKDTKDAKTMNDSKTSKAAKNITISAIGTTPTESALKPKARKIKIETPGDSITVSRKNAKNDSHLKLPTVRKLHFRISQVIGIIILLLLAGFIARVAIWEHNYLERMEGSERHLPPNIGGIGGVGETEEEVDEERPTETEITEYVVAPEKPRYFSIPSLGINNTRIVEIGLKNNGEIATPYNIYDVGWYQNSALPGTSGVTVMDGHGGGPGIGIFGSLPKISIGAEIFIEMGDGRAFRYRVVDTATKALGEEANSYMTEAFTSPETGTGSLTLITCTGDYWLASRTYSHRFFLRATLEQ